MRKRKLGWIAVIVVTILGVTGYAGAKIYAQKNAQKEMDRLVASSANRARIQYGGLRVTWVGFDVQIHDVIIEPLHSPEKMRVEKITLTEIDPLHQPPHSLKMAFKGLMIKTGDSQGFSAHTLKELGCTDLRVDLEVEYRFIPESKEFIMEKWRLKAENLGRLSLDARLIGVPFDVLDKPGGPFMFLIALPQIALGSASLNFEDDGLTDRLLTAEAKTSGLTKQEYLANLLQRLEEEKERSDKPAVKKALTEIKKFLENPRELNITARPSEPVALLDVKSHLDASDLAGPLNLEVRAN